MINKQIIDNRTDNNIIDYLIKTYYYISSYLFNIYNLLIDYYLSHVSYIPIPKPLPHGEI